MSVLITGLLIPLVGTAAGGEHSNIGIVSFAIGFSLMMALDVALG
jgi:ZIP family zinc transporter